MPPTPTITFSQPTNPGSPNVALYGTIALGDVTAQANATGAKRWAWSWVDAPPGSAIVRAQAFQDSLSLTSVTFTPDVAGSYLLQLDEYDAQGNVGTTYLTFGVKNSSGRLPTIPAMIPFQGFPDPQPALCMNFGGQLRGYAPIYESYCAAVDAGGGGGGGAVAPLALVGTGDAVQLSVKAFAGQASKLQSWISSGGPTVASVSAAGAFVGLSFDEAAAGALNIGVSVATSVVIGANTIPTNIVGNLRIGIAANVATTGTIRVASGFSVYNRTSNGLNDSLVVADDGSDNLTIGDPTHNASVTLASGGNINATAPVNFQEHGNPGFTFTDQPADGQSTSATLVTLYTYALPLGTTAFRAEIVATKSDRSDGASMVINGTYRNNAGVITTILASNVTENTHGTWLPSLVVSGTNVLLKFAGAIGTTTNISSDIQAKVRP